MTGSGSSGAASSAQTLLLMIVLGLVTLWFTNIVMRALDILYRPQVRRWMGPKAPETTAEDNLFKVDDLSLVYDDEYLEELERELMALKALRRKKGEARRPRQDLPVLGSIKKARQAEMIRKKAEVVNEEESRNVGHCKKDPGEFYQERKSNVSIFTKAYQFQHDTCSAVLNESVCRP